MQTVQRFLFSVGCVLALALQSFAVSQQRPVPRFEMSGLNFNDEFDRIFSTARACPTQEMTKMYKDGGLKGPYRCNPVADAFLHMIVAERAAGIPVEEYLRSKGGTCSGLDDGTRRCVVQREVTVRTYVDESMPAHADRTLFSLRVDIREPDGDIHTDIERYDFAPGESRG